MLRTLYLCLFLSGFAALVYEVLWVRLLTLFFGHTAIAASAVLSAYMLGLGLGGFAGGKIADRTNPAKLLPIYIVIEIAIAASAVLTKPLISVLNQALPLFLLKETSSGAQNAIWFLISFGLFLIPTVLMGTTLPLLAKWFSSLRDRNGEASVSLLYGFNTLGAVIGTGTAGFFLIPSFGMTKTFAFAAAMNIASSALAYLIHKLKSPDLDSNWGPAAASKPSFLVFDRPIKQLGFVLLLSGLASMMCEIAWTRGFALVLGSSTYAFTIMLVTFLMGLSLGSVSYRWVRNYLEPSYLTTAFFLLLIALATMAYLPVFNKLPYYYVRLFPTVGPSVFLTHLTQFLLCAFIMFFPTLFMGLLFPWTLSLIAKKESVASQVGILYAFNTAGTIMGAAMAGLLFLPKLGAESTLVGASWLYGFCAILAIFFSPVGTLTRKAAFSSTALVLMLTVHLLRPAWNPYHLSSGIFLYAPQYMNWKGYDQFSKSLQQNRLIFYKDGVSSTVSVMETPWGDRFLRVNGKTDASSGPDMLTQTLQGALPILMHAEKPSRALVIGFGSGVTAGSMAGFESIKSIDCIEIEPAVAEAAVFFAKANRDVMNNPKFKIHYTDGRHFLAATQDRYDIITSEPSNPWISGVANLFTEESFTLAKNKLAYDGIFCQWFHSYSMSVADFKSVMKTFASVFPHTMLFTTGEKDFFLVGSLKPWDIQYAKLTRDINSNEELVSDLSMFGFQHPFSLLSALFLLDDPEFRSFADSGSIHRDDHPFLEFSTPHFIHRSQDVQILALLWAAKSSMLPSSLKGLNASNKEWATLYNVAGEAYMRTQKIEPAEQAFLKAKDYDSSNARTWTNLGRVYNIREEHLKSQQAYETAIKHDPRYSLAWFHMGMLHVGQQMEDKGLAYLEKGLSYAPNDPMGCLQISRIYIRRGQKEKAKVLLTRALSQQISNSTLYVSLVQALESLDQIEKT